MDTHFSTILATTLEHEGKYSCDPDDPGEETYRGISRAHWPNWSGWAVIDAAKGHPSFPDNIREDQLSLMVRTFYSINFWRRVGGHYIKDPGIAKEIFDFAVNAGVKTSIKLAQRTVGAKDDGIFGKKTLALMNECPPEEFIAAFRLLKVGRYIKLCQRNPKLRKYFFGWIRRAVA